jgi:hypothetical protein
MQKRTQAECRDHWEKLFPSKGAVLAEILHPFAGWQPKLSTVSHAIELMVRETRPIFWRQIAGINLHISTLRRHEVVLTLEDSLREALGEEIAEVLDKGTGNLLREQLEKEIGVGLSLFLGHPFLFSLLCPCAYALGGRQDKVEQFKPLLNLWLAGFFPEGFDHRGKLILQAASARS